MEDRKIITTRMSRDLKYKIVSCIRSALEDDLDNFKTSSNLVTNNGVPFLKGDYINTRLQNELADENIEVIPFKRYGWESRIVVDHINKVAYNVISKSRVQQLMKDAASSTVPHYSMLFAYTLNSDLKAPEKQTSMFDNYPFSDETMTEGYNKLLGGQLQPTAGYNYCVIVYEISDGQLNTCEALILDKDLDLVEKISLADFIKPDYASLTPTVSADKQFNSGETVQRVKLKRHSTNQSLVSLKEEEKKA